MWEVQDFMNILVTSLIGRQRFLESSQKYQLASLKAFAMLRHPHSEKIKGRRKFFHSFISLVVLLDAFLVFS